MKRTVSAILVRMIIKITPIQLFILAVIFMLTACSNAQESNQNAGGEQSRTSGHTTLNRESPRSTKFTNMELLGQVTFKTGFTYQGVELGGLSGITYDTVNNLYYAISDDPGNKAPARFYTLKIALNDGTLDEGDVTFMALTTLYDKNHQPFPKDSIDPESLVITKSRTLFISSEGNANYKIDPFIRQFSLDGSYLSSLRIPLKFLPTAGPDIGIRNNLAFESLTLTPDEAYLFTGIENALNQDGPNTSVNTASPSRILKYDLATGERMSEYLYWVEPVVAQPIPSDGFNVNGLVELIALDEYTLISLERSYSVGVGNAIRLYQTSLMNADDISSFDRLDAVDLSTIHAAAKSLLFDLSKFGIPLDNIEGMTFGPKLMDGRQILILVSDNNFNPLRQFTQFIAMAMNTSALLPQPETDTTIHEIQGAAHSSPLSGRHVKNVLGIVTAVQKSGRNRGFWMQAPHADDNAATSEGIFVLTGKELPQVEVGDAIQVSGTVAEYGFPGELTTTQLVNPEVQVLSHGNELPAAQVIGFGGKIPPTQVIDDDSLQTFDPETDGIDFYESLEGMLVQVNDAVVVGPTSNYGEIVILADRGRNASVRTTRGGIVVRPQDFNPERILVDDRLVSGSPNVNVGDRFDGAIVGVVDYSFGNFKLLNTEPLPRVISAGLTPETRSFLGDEEQLTVATFNVENLDFADREDKFQRLAQIIAKNLAAPDIVALQEMQDDTGSKDDGVVDARKTFQRLLEIIKTVGGPRYEFRQINPLNNQDGSQPGGNIRVGFLFNPARVRFVDRGQGGAVDGTEVVAGGQGPHLKLSPGRVAPDNPAFNKNKATQFSATRKSLAGEFVFNGQKIFLINNHLKSKRGDDRLFGARQPPQLQTEIQRCKQALVLNDFVKTLLSQDRNANIIVVGDLNEHEFRPPLQLLSDSLLTNLVGKVPLEERFTYIFNGNAQVLDHILVSRNLMLCASPQVDIVHVNSEFAEKKRASDHDPIVARFTISNTNKHKRLQGF